jgi:hypothetical protein
VNFEVVCGDTKKLKLDDDVHNHPKCTQKGLQELPPVVPWEELIWFSPRSDRQLASRGITLDIWRDMTANLDTLNNADKYFYEALAFQNNRYLPDLSGQKGKKGPGSTKESAAAKGVSYQTRAAL